MSSANELLNWVEESLGLSYLNEAPPGEFERLLANKENLEVVAILGAGWLLE